MGILSKFFRGRRETQEPLVLAGPGKFAIDVVGESHYQEELETICGGRTEDGANEVVDAFLFLDDDNPYDRQAVAVVIHGKVVGYFPRETARSYRKQLQQSGLGLQDAVCKAKVVGGWDRGRDDRGHFGVKVDLPSGG